MNANFVCLGFVLMLLGLFNAIFIGGFFKTAYKFTRSFISFIIAVFMVTGIGETLFHIPGLAALNAFGFEHTGLQICVFALVTIMFSALTLFSTRRTVRDFERIDLWRETESVNKALFI